MKNSFIGLLCLFSTTGFAQIDPGFNLNLEQHSMNSSLPDDWSVSGSGYEVNTDTMVRHSGKSSICIHMQEKSLHKQFGACEYTFRSKYQGKKIELRGFLKIQDVKNGFAGIWMRIDGESGFLEFDNMAKKKLHGSRDWTEYSIILPLPERATRIHFGALLTGTGTIWTDDFSLLIDGKDMAEAPYKEIRLYKADEDRKFDFGSNIDIETPSGLKIEDLAILGQVWGFLKYYHPAIARGDYNWDYELFRILPKVIEAKYPEERNIVLANWVKSLGALETGRNKRPKGKHVKMNPALDWINETHLGVTLSKLLKEVKDAKRTEDHYYVDLFRPEGHPVFKHEKTYNTITFPDDGFTMLCLFRYWNAMQYYNPNRQFFNADWQQVLREFIPKFAGCDNRLSYSLTTQELICKVDDAHSNFEWNRTMNHFFGENYSTVLLDLIENKPVVTGFTDSVLGSKTGLMTGDVIEMVNGRTVDDIISQRLPYTKASSNTSRMKVITENMLRSNETVLNIKYKRAGMTDSCRITMYPNNGTIDLDYKYTRPDTCFKLVAPGIAYLYMGSLRNDKLEKLIPEILKTKGLIIDLRCKPVDGNGYALATHLLSKPIPYGVFSYGSLLNPGLFTIGGVTITGNKNIHPYKGQLIILVNEMTRGNAESQALALMAVPGAIMVGSNTAGEAKNVSFIPLPGGYGTWMSGIGMYLPDGGQLQGIGIVPDIFVKPTVEGSRQGRDEVLEKALQVIQSL